MGLPRISVDIILVDRVVILSLVGFLDMKSEIMTPRTPKITTKTRYMFIMILKNYFEVRMVPFI